MRKTVFKLICTSLLALIVYDALAYDELKWGKLSKAEKEIKGCDFAPDCPAVILADQGYVSFGSGSGVKIGHHRRIKFFQGKDLSYGNISISLYTHEGYENLDRIKAHVFVPEGNGKYKQIKLKKEDFHEIQVNERRTEIRFTFPQLQAGAIIEYQLTYYSQSVRFLEAWTFENELPTLKSQFKADIPEGLDYRILYVGDRLLQKYDSSKQNEWELENLLPLRHEPGISTPLDYANRIRFQLAGYHKRRDVLNGGGYEYVNTMTSWEELAKELLKDPRWETYLKQKGNSRRFLEENWSDHYQKDAEQLEALRNLVAKYFKWNSQLSFYPGQSFHRLQKSQEGNSADLNLALVSLAKALGFNSTPILISTRSHGKVSLIYPVLSQFNHLVCGVQLEDGLRILDATDGKLSINYIHPENMVDGAVMLEKEGVNAINLSKLRSGSKLVYYSSLTIEEDKAIHRSKLALKGYKAFKVIAGNENDADWLDILFKVELGETRAIEEEERLSDEVKLKYVTAKEIQSDIFELPLFRVNSLVENLSANKHRLYPYENLLPYEAVFLTTVKIPEGYEVLNKEILTDESGKEGQASYELSVSELSKNTLQYQLRVHLPSGKVLPNAYADYVNFIQAINSTKAKTIILKTKTS